MIFSVVYPEPYGYSAMISDSPKHYESFALRENTYCIDQDDLVNHTASAGKQTSMIRINHYFHATKLLSKLS